MTPALSPDFPAPEGRQGWPWTIDAAASNPSNIPPAGSPSIALVIISFNQDFFLEEAIRSALLQDPPPEEIWVIDGGSRDRSVDIIRRYERWLTGWISEKDRGQSDAINKGLSRCTADVVNWLCSDDVLLPGALDIVRRSFAADPALDVVAGNGRYHWEDGSRPDASTALSARALYRLPAVNLVVQPSCFFRRRLLDRSPPIREDLHYTMDLELWTRFSAAGARWKFVPQDLSIYRVTGDNKSFKGRAQTLGEIHSVYAQYVRQPVPLWRWFGWCWLPAARWRAGAHSPKSRRIADRGVRMLERLLGWLYSPDHVAGFATSYQWYAVEPWLAQRSLAQSPSRPN
ncbi:MAG: glycosyltransferase [Verrucomicrobiales bacterium]|nr:glycosyltransferase [Verrucomicrobiales bacterium]